MYCVLCVQVSHTVCCVYRQVSCTVCCVYRQVSHTVCCVYRYHVLCVVCTGIMYCVLCVQAVKLESSVPGASRYMAVVSTMGRQDTEESVVLGIDIVQEKATIGLVLPVWCDVTVHLDGDGSVWIGM